MKHVNKQHYQSSRTGKACDICDSTSLGVVLGRSVDTRARAVCVATALAAGGNVEDFLSTLCPCRCRCGRVPKSLLTLAAETERALGGNNELLGVFELEPQHDIGRERAALIALLPLWLTALDVRAGPRPAPAALVTTESGELRLARPSSRRCSRIRISRSNCSGSDMNFRQTRFGFLPSRRRPKSQAKTTVQVNDT